MRIRFEVLDCQEHPQYLTGLVRGVGPHDVLGLKAMTTSQTSWHSVEKGVGSKTVMVMAADGKMMAHSSTLSSRAVS